MLEPPLKPCDPYPKQDGIKLKNPTSDTSCNSHYGSKIAPHCQWDWRKRSQQSFSTVTTPAQPKQRDTSCFSQAHSSQNSAAWRGEVVIALVAACAVMASVMRKHPSLFSHRLPFRPEVEMGHKLMASPSFSACLIKTRQLRLITTLTQSPTATISDAAAVLWYLLRLHGLVKKQVHLGRVSHG